MKQQIFTRKSVNQYADFLLEIANSEEIEDDFITEMLAEKMSRLEAINTFKESVMIYCTYIRFCLIEEDYECADKFKSIVTIEYTNTIALLNAIGELTVEDEVIMSTIVDELNYIMNKNI